MNDLAKAEREELSMMFDLRAGPRLEGRIARAPGQPLVVLCHPHPLFGGSMDNAMVRLARDTAWELGLGTLRFNFRGVGQSEGGWGGGTGEAKDLSNLLELVSRGDHAPDGVILLGYSFGAWTAVRACDAGFQPRSLCLVSPPVDFLSFAGVTLPAAPCLVVVGEQDDLCALPRLRSWLRAQPDDRQPVLKEVPEADHYWAHGAAALRQVLLGWLTE
ncbi:MAG: hypothetical protein JRI23_21535 [Deltaproteobacteria bacterium]|jgi:alpha/beta superfamily hydrolase|nr:hypothetical protein [Deltaproteobacteria bacterium]MBW2534525.1 hypothetical protein [Deltaproteobacteria bacterium]